MSYEGILPIWKPAGFTSHDVVAKVRRIVKMKRIGHTGTLDPEVTGVLPLCLGRATRLVEYIQELPKTYDAELTLGLSTNTEDLTGQIIENHPNLEINRNQIEQALMSMVGEIEQIPPMFSAIQVNGKRLYDLAREGITIERKPRKVTIHSITIGEMHLHRQYPVVSFRVVCSKGTYIRTLCTDVGRKLKVPAVMNLLIRSSTGGITAENCLKLEQLDELVQNNLLESMLIPADKVISYLPRITVSESEAVFALQGKSIACPFNEQIVEDDLIRLYALESTKFLGIFQLNNRGCLIPIKVFS